MTETPPPSTLSTPSPTERDPRHHEPPTSHDIPPSSVLLEMNTPQALKPLHLIVATSLHPPLGIGLKGTLPWPSIKSDMTFFRRATTGGKTWSTSKTHQLNAVIMGRKTYESIPAKFRPLSDRVNVVLTRHGVREMAHKVLRELTEGSEGEEPSEYRLVDQGSEGGMESGVAVSIVRRDEGQPLVMVTDSVRRAVGVDADRVFCIGGAEVYGVVMREERRRVVRVLQTLVRKLDGSGFKCDTFWPEEMEGGKGGWREVERGEVEEWAGGVGVPQGEEAWFKDEKARVEIRTVGWERKAEGV